MHIIHHVVRPVTALWIVLLLLWSIPTDQMNSCRAGKQADLSSIRFYSQTELLGVHQSVFETLFLRPWEEKHWEYALDLEVTGRGVYRGRNQYGQEFEFDIRAFAPVDLGIVRLEPEHRKWARDNAFKIAGAIGELRHGETRVRVHGRIVSTRNADGSTSCRFWLCNTVPSNSALFDPQPPIPRLTACPPNRWSSAGMDQEHGERSCASNCADSKSNAISTAGRSYDSAVETADAQRDIAVDLALGTYQTEVAQAESTLATALVAATAGETSCLLVCAFTGPATLPCVAGYAAAYAIAVAAAHVNYNNEIAGAEERRDMAVNAANATFEIALNAAENAYQQAAEAANQAYSACLAACPGGGAQPGGGGPERFVEPE